MVEQAQLKGGGSAACVKDIVRAMSVVDSMAEIAEALEILLHLQNQGKIMIVRVKERFLEAPSSGGWRGNTCLVKNDTQMIYKNNQTIFCHYRYPQHKIKSFHRYHDQFPSCSIKGAQSHL